jgi:hypothetical protein
MPNSTTTTTPEHPGKRAQRRTLLSDFMDGRIDHAEYKRLQQAIVFGK